MEFSFDVSQTPLIGRRLLLKPDLETNVSTQAKISQPSNVNITGTPNSPRRSTSLSPADTAPLSGWKRPWMSQGRVRECLVNLLTTCGQRVGLPKSPSVSQAIKTLISQLISFVGFHHFCSIILFYLNCLIIFIEPMIFASDLFFSSFNMHGNIFVFRSAGNKDEILSSLCSKVNVFAFGVNE